MKIVYFGSDAFLPCFDYLTKHHQILALYTYHNDEDYFTEYSIVRRANALCIPVHYEAITKGKIIDYMKEGCELFFIAEYNRILDVPDDNPKFRGINTHSSLLPQGRSYYPIEAAMERGLSKTGVTMHKLAKKLDGGEILAHCEIPIAPEVDSIDIYLKCSYYALEMLVEILSDFDKKWTNTSPPVTDSPYWKRPADELLTLHNGMTRCEAQNIFRKYNSMTQIQIDGKWYYVTALDSGMTAMQEDFRFLAENRLLYKLLDGHLRLHILAKQKGEIDL